MNMYFFIFFFFSSRRRHTRYWRDWSSDVCSSDLRDRDAAALVDDRDGVVRVDRDRDGVVATRQRLVDGVVDDLVDQVVQTANAGRPDVHARALADRLEALEDRDVLGVVARALLIAVAVGSVVAGHVPPSFTRRRPGDGAVSARGRGEASTCSG